MIPTDRQSVAIHEAGHCVVARAMGLTVVKVELESDGGGSTYTVPLPSLSPVHKCAYVAGGRIAELLVFGALPDAAAFDGDMESMERAARGVWPTWKRAQAMQDGDRLAREIVSRNLRAVGRVAGELLSHGTLTGADVNNLTEDVR